MSRHDFVGEWVKQWAEKSNVRVEYYKEATSTNDLAKQMDYERFDLVLFATENQTKGRGRGSNTWTNPEKGSSLLSSWSFGMDKAPQPTMTLLLGLGVYRALQQVFGFKNLRLKEPNDIYLGNKKVGGILVEVLSQGNQHRLIIGIGLNVFKKPELEIATCLAEHTDHDITHDLFSSFLDALLVEWTHGLEEGTKPEISPALQSEIKRAQG